MAAGGMNLEQQFGNFSKFDDTRSDGKSITLTNVDKWFKQAKVIEVKKVTTTDTGVVFNKFKSRTITYSQFIQFLDELAKYKNTDVNEFKDKLTTCGLPAANTAPQAGKPGEPAKK